MSDKEYKDFIIESIQKSPDIDDEVIDFFFSDRQKFILGTGRQAAVCLEICRNMGAKISGIIPEYHYDLSERKGYWKELIASVKMAEISDITDKNSSQVLMAVRHDDYEKYRDMLISKGFIGTDIYTCNWKHNVDLRDICYYAYEKKIGMSN